MLSSGGFFMVMLKSAFVVAFLSVPSPVVAFSSGIKHWSRRALYHQIDLCSQVCYHQIIPGLYLSNARAACDRSVLRNLDITHVLTIEAHRLPKSAFSHTNITTLFIRAYDHPKTNLMPYFPMANAFIEEGLQKGNVLVHCHFGVSRSATLVIAYLMEKYQLTFDQAYAYVKSRRSFINPNAGFVTQLRQYQRLGYQINGYHRLEAYMAVQGRKHRYKIASLAAVVVGILVPMIVLVG